MIEHSIVVKEEDLIRYLKENWRGFETKDYELLAAVFLCRFHKKQFNQVFQVGFPVLTITDKHVKNEYKYENIKSILKNYIREETPIDIFLIPEKNINNVIANLATGGRPKTKGNAFQIKRVGSRKNGDITESIANYLKELPKKYAPVQAALVLVIGGGKTEGTVDLEKLRQLFRPDNFPFQKVLFMAGDGAKVVFGEIWPNFGFEDFPIDDIFYL